MITFYVDPPLAWFEETLIIGGENMRIDWEFFWVRLNQVSWKPSLFHVWKDRQRGQRGMRRDLKLEEST